MRRRVWWALSALLAAAASRAAAEADLVDWERRAREPAGAPAPSLAFVARAPEETVELRAAMPAFFLDHTGFALPADDPFLVAGLQPGLPTYPLLPVLKDGKIASVVIPDGQVAAPRGVISNMPSGPEMEAAFALIRHAGFAPLIADGKVIGVRPGSGFSYSRQSGFSIGLDLSSLFARDAFRIEDKSGLHIDLADPFNRILAHARALLVGPRAKETVAELLAFMPYLQAYLAASAAPTSFTEKGALRPAVRNARLAGVESRRPRPALAISRDRLSGELRGSLETLERKVGEEARFRARLQDAVGRMLVVDMVDENRLIQEVCDYLGAGMELPEPLWPRCRIAATLVPNAFALPGGDVFVTAGLVGVLSDLDPLIYVLGHELGHAVGRHTSKRVAFVDAAQGGMNALGIAAQVFSLAGGPWIGHVTLLSWLPKAMASSQMTGIGMQLAGYGALATMMAYNRGQEWEADRTGHQLALAVGARQDGLGPGWREFMGWYTEYLGVSSDGGIMASHPPAAAREEAIGSRHKEFRHLEREFAAGNRLPEEYYEAYRGLHAQFAPMAHEFGRYLKDKKGAAERQGDAARKSLLSPGGQCVMHALRATD